jgi:hypothetical protein
MLYKNPKYAYLEFICGVCGTKQTMTAHHHGLFGECRLLSGLDCWTVLLGGLLGSLTVPLRLLGSFSGALTPAVWPLIDCQGPIVDN